MSTKHAPAGPFALVLQGGGALGAYELGAARRVYAGADKAKPFTPDVIAGVSIGAISAALLARPKHGDPLAALEAFWREVALIGWPFPPIVTKFAAVFGNPHFFMPRTDYFDFANWTSLYDNAPLRRTIDKLVDMRALADPAARPRLILSATDIGGGQIEYFDSASKNAPLSLEHIMASASLPPFFPMTRIDNRTYWDGGLFDNTPLGPVLDALNELPGEERCVIVVNLFPNAAPVPFNMREVGRRMLNLLFANRTRQDLKLLKRFNEVAALVWALEQSLPAGSSIAREELDVLRRRGYIRVPHVIEITRQSSADESEAYDFSREGIEARADQGWRGADEALAAHGL